MHGEHSRRLFDILDMVYVVALKAGGDSVQTIRSLLGMLTIFGFLGLFGTGTASFSAPLGVR